MTTAPKKPTKKELEELAATLDNEIAGTHDGKVGVLEGTEWRRELRRVLAAEDGYERRSQLLTATVGAMARHNVVDKGIPGRVYVTELGVALAYAIGDS